MTNTTENASMEATFKIRGGYLCLFNPKKSDFSEDLKYSLEGLVSKTDKVARAAINKAIHAAVTSKWGTTPPKFLKMPLRDGDLPGEAGMGKKAAEPGSAPYGGNFFMTISNTRKPGLVDQQLNDIIDPSKIKSGDWFNVCVRFYPFDSNGNKGVGCSLQGLQFIESGEALASEFVPEDKFKPIAPSEASGEDLDYLN